MKRLCLTGCMALLMGACTHTPKEYKLTGTFEGSPVDYVLIGHGFNNVANADTVRIAPDGSFSYTRNMEKPETGFVYVPDKAFYPLILINGTSTHLQANPDTPTSYTFTGDLKNAQAFYLEASNRFNEKCGAEYSSFNILQRVLTAVSDSIGQAAKEISPKDFAVLMADDIHTSQEEAELGYIDQLLTAGKAADSDANYNRYMESLDTNREKCAMAYIRWKEASVNPGNPPSYARMLDVAKEKIQDADVLEKTAMELMGNYFNECDADLETVYRKVLPLVKDRERQEWITQMYKANKNLIPGADAIDCELEDANGHKSRLSALYGKVLYLDIWGTWCGPCCEEIPYMEKLAEHFRGDTRIVPISISIDGNTQAWISKLKADKPQWAQYLCPNFAKLYGIAGIPCFILIDKQGKIITTKAPRPSDPECINIISRYLK